MLRIAGHRRRGVNTSSHRWQRWRSCLGAHSRVRGE
jgi:hypothetical protein